MKFFSITSQSPHCTVDHDLWLQVNLTYVRIISKLSYLNARIKRTPQYFRAVLSNNLIEDPIIVITSFNWLIIAPKLTVIFHIFLMFKLTDLDTFFFFGSARFLGSCLITASGEFSFLIWSISGVNSNSIFYLNFLNDELMDMH